MSVKMFKIKTLHPVDKVISQDLFNEISANTRHCDHTNLVHECIGEHDVYYIRVPEVVELHPAIAARKKSAILFINQ